MDTSVYCLNVGQANCVAIIDPFPNGSLGHYQASLIDLGVDGKRLAIWLDDIGVRRIPLIALSHNDEDHVFGLESVVQAYRRRIGRLLFVVDRPPELIPYWLEAQRWVADGWVGQIGQLDTPAAARPGMGRVLVEPPDVSYRLHCIYPDVFEHYAAAQGAPRVGARTGRGPNATSAVLGLVRPANPSRTRVLFGGDLDLPGWRCLVESGHRLNADILIVPHHGGPRKATASFGPGDLARAIQPRFAIISVGTLQGGGYGHPHQEVVRAFREQGATIFCTQLTRRCHDAPQHVPDRTVVGLPLLTSVDLGPSGVACAGSVVVVIRDSGHLSVSRRSIHQNAVDQLLADGHHPLCRP